MTAKYNLIIFHVPGKQSRSDFEAVKMNAAVRAPDIAVHIVSLSKQLPDLSFWAYVAQKPSLIFSPIAVKLGSTPLIRGTRIISKFINKFEEIKLMESAGARVPETIVLSPEARLDEAHWGPFVVLKPSHGKRGNGVRLVRTKDVRWVDTASLPEDEPWHRRQVLVQRFIDTGPFITSYRVMTVLGRPIYSVVSKSRQERPDPRTSASPDMDVASNNVDRDMKMNYDTEVIDFAKSIHAKLPHLPAMGIDVIREQSTGKLFALEFNSGGRFWHISSDYGLEQQRKYGTDYKSQFNALDTISDALIEVTRKRAI